MTLLEFTESRNDVVMFWVSIGQPAGDYEPLGNPWFDFAERRSLVDLEGEVNASGVWQWTGEGRPRDDRGNSITKVEAYEDERKHKEICDEYESAGL